MTEPRDRPGSSGRSVTRVSAPDGAVTVTGEVSPLTLCRSIGDVAPVRGGAQRLLLEVGLLHQPVGEPARQVEVGAAVLVAARPQPDLVAQHQGDAALVLARQHQQRPVVGAGHHGHALDGLAVDLAEPLAPGGRVLVAARQAARDRVLLAVGASRLARNGCSITAPVGPHRRERAERRIDTARRARRSPARPPSAARRRCAHSGRCSRNRRRAGSTGSSSGRR